MALNIPLIALILVPIAALVAIGLAIYLAFYVMKKEPGNEAMVRVAGYIEEGANAFIKRQYLTLSIFTGAVAIVVLLFLPNPLIEFGENDVTLWILKGTIPSYSPQELPTINWQQTVAYIVGSIASGFAGWLGMKVGVKANTRTAEAARKGLTPAFNVSFFGGAVMGLMVTGAALGGIIIFYAIWPEPGIVLGFSFGASTIALFAKAGGGIFTKTADVGADLVGKGEYDLPEDDPRNPAAVADNVGDNVGDIAGMGADLFDSYVASIVAAMILAAAYLAFGVDEVGNILVQVDIDMLVVYPIIISAVGLIASLIGILWTRFTVKEDPGKALNLGTYISTIAYVVLNALVTWICVQGLSPDGVTKLWKNNLAGALGLVAGVLIGFTTDYYTNDAKRPTQKVAEAAESGHAPVILSGFAYGLESVVAPTLGIIIAMAVSWFLDGVYGISTAGVGMLAIVATIVSNDAYGPIVDNARGIAEQGGLDEEVIRDCDRLDSAGNTAKAITKGVAIGAAALTVLALLYAYSGEARVANVDLLRANVLIGALLGSITPAYFSAVLIKAVDRNAQKMIAEIRRQFTEMPGILEGTQKADYARCVDIATKGSLQELVIPIAISIGAPIITGILFGVAGLSAFLAGTILSGLLFAILMSTAGGTWDNAKKYIEEGHHGGKGTEAHKAAITGDTVGDPFKDTAGPSINTLITVESLTATIFVGLFLVFNDGKGLLEFLNAPYLSNVPPWLIIILLAALTLLFAVIFVVIPLLKRNGNNN
ncbi:MAG: sodium-translocating pyrophosphatase [Candidatus Lokiarchaeota archaeon]|nr:sodium-translocating pyrophosphatase [Candidatus Lokiarchaeota archaeon]